MFKTTAYWLAAAAAAVAIPLAGAPAASADLPACKRLPGPVCDRTLPVDTSHAPKGVKGHLSGKYNVNDGKKVGVLG